MDFVTRQTKTAVRRIRIRHPAVDRERRGEQRKTEAAAAAAARRIRERV